MLSGGRGRWGFGSAHGRKGGGGGGVNGKRAHTEKNSLHPGYFCSNVLNLERAIY